MRRRACHGRVRFSAALLGLCAIVGGCQSRSDARGADDLTVFAAASATNAVQALVAAFERQSEVRVRCSFAGSSLLARQIESGAAADVFLSANQEWMDYLSQRQRIDAASRFDLLTNRLVLIAPVGVNASSHVTSSVAGANPCDLIRRTSGRIALADPAHVPAGEYARAALETLGCWEAIDERCVLTNDVRAALRFVERGETALGLVYATDAAISDRVRVVGEFPADSHPPIRYSVAGCRDASPRAAEFLAFLRSAEAREIIRAAGFGLPED